MRALAQAVAVTLVLAVVGCSAPVHVSFDERQDFVRYRTWAWASGSSHHIDAPHVDPHLVHARVAALIEGELRALGLERVRRSRADLFVAYRLLMRRESVSVTRKGPTQTLTSFHGVLYVIEPVETELRTYESSRLVIGLAAPDGKLIWVGELDRRVRRSSERHLADAVASILSRFPPPSQPGGRGPAHPPTLQDGQRMLAAMFSGVGPGAHSKDEIEGLP